MTETPNKAPGSAWGSEENGRRAALCPPAGPGALLTRRQALRLGVCGAAGLVLADAFGRRLQAAPQPFVPTANPNARAKAVIQIWMWGGPAHLDTFDPKPAAGYDYCGPLDKPIATNVDGIRIGQLLPELAQHADKYSIIRSMTHGVNAHETASYLVQTGHEPGDGLVWPGLGAVTTLFKGASGRRGLVPPYIVISELQGRFSEAGFLGSGCKPFATGGDPGAARFAVEGVVAEGRTDERQKAARALLGKLNTLEHVLPEDPQLAAAQRCEDEAYELILGDAGKVFDLSQESDALRERYGRNTFGQSCLAARRLIEKGVPFVTINSKGWDTHKQHFQTMNRRLPEVDKGMATLLSDLSERGLLDSTIVWWGGEFGRTPKVQWEPPWNGGRGHWGPCFSMVVAGGGFKGGHVVGASDERGEQVAARPVYPVDLLASMYELLGIDPDGPLAHPQGLKLRVSPAAGAGVKMGGRLKEIM